MAQAWRRIALLEVCRKARLSERQVLFLNGVVQYADASGLLVDSSLSSATVALNVPWFASLLKAHQLDPNFRAAHVERAQTAARLACDKFSAFGADLLQCDDWRQRINGLSPASFQSTSFAATNAETEQHKLQVIALGLHLSDARALTYDTIERLAMEIGAYAISAGADADLFVQTMSSCPTYDRNIFLQKVGEVLALKNFSYRAILTVAGSRVFENLDAVDPDLDLKQVSGRPGDFPGWGTSGNFAQQYTLTVLSRKPRSWRRHQLETERAVLTVRVDAVDDRAAAVGAYRSVTEALDNYIAAHPWARLSVDPQVGVTRGAGGGLNFVSLDPPPDESVAPLLTPLPSQLRQATRMAHLLRNATAPMTAVALAWVTLEALGVEPSQQSRRQVSRMLALLLLRQTVFNSYRKLTQDLLNAKQGQQFLRRADVALRSMEKYARRAADPRVPGAYAARQKAASLKSRMLHDFFVYLATRYRKDYKDVQVELRALDAILHPATSTPSRHATFLKNATGWLDILQGGPANRGSALVSGLLSSVTPSTRNLIKKLRTMSNNGIAVAAALEEFSSWMEGVLAAFNAGRNLNLHTGAFENDGDLAMAELARHVPDAIFEVLGAWYRSSTMLSPEDIFVSMSDRYSTVIAHLNSGGHWKDIDVDNLTGPGWTTP